MNNKSRVICIILLIIMVASFMIACNPEAIDYADRVKLDMTSNTAKQEVTVKTHIDGDTSHFNVPKSVDPSGAMKARYLAINTPETTNRVEEYGKAAAAFTRSKLESAESVYIESDDSEWNLDSTGTRYLLWVWYKPQGAAEYRNLNIEILQSGYAIASNISGNRYGRTATDALEQARNLKLNIFSGKPDPDYYYGGTQEVTLKELRTNIQQYSGTLVAFEGNVIRNSGSNGVYVEDYDSDTDTYYGMYVYYGYSLNALALDIVSVGNRARIVGTAQYYEIGGTYQVAGLQYDMWNPDDPGSMNLISKGHKAANVVTSADKFLNGKVSVVNGQGELVSHDYAKVAVHTSIAMNNLVVQSIYVTDNDDSSQKGAMTLTCKVDGKTIVIRTAVLRDADGNLITPDSYLGKTINVTGIIDYYDEVYQIKVLSRNDITIL